MSTQVNTTKEQKKVITLKYYLIHWSWFLTRKKEPQWLKLIRLYFKEAVTSKWIFADKICHANTVSLKPRFEIEKKSIESVLCFISHEYKWIVIKTVIFHVRTYFSNKTKIILNGLSYLRPFFRALQLNTVQLAFLKVKIGLFADNRPERWWRHCVCWWLWSAWIFWQPMPDAFLLLNPPDVLLPRPVLPPLFLLQPAALLLEIVISYPSF